MRKVRTAGLDLSVVMVATRLPARSLVRNPSLQFAATLLKPLPGDALLDMVKIVLRDKTSPIEPVAPHIRTLKQLLQELNQHRANHGHSGLNE